MSFNSKYSGQQVENLLDQVANGNTGGGGGGITTETDPIFSASPASKITDENITSWNNKVDKVDGKQLSTEDFTTLLKQKLDGLSNYDDTEIQEAVSKLRTDLDTLVSGDTTTAIKTFNEVIAFLDGIEDSESLDAIIASIEQQIAAKGTYSKPSTGIPESDLSSAVQTSLRKANTALQEIPSSYVTQGYLNSQNYVNSSYVNSQVSPLTTSISAKQDRLVSGANIRTINGKSILGGGNIVIEGGSSGVGGKEYVDAPTILEPSGTLVYFDSNSKLEPNKVYVVTNKEISGFLLSYNAVDMTDSLCDEYSIMFKTGSDGASITIPEDWIVSNNSKLFRGYVEISIVRTTYQDGNIFKVVIANFEQS